MAEPAAPGMSRGGAGQGEAKETVPPSGPS